MQILQERFDFLAKYRHTVPEEDFEVAMKAYEWPKKFVSIIKEAAAKATSGTHAMQIIAKKSVRCSLHQTAAQFIVLTHASQAQEVLNECF